MLINDYDIGQDGENIKTINYLDTSQKNLAKFMNYKNMFMQLKHYEITTKKQETRLSVIADTMRAD